MTEIKRDGHCTSLWQDSANINARETSSAGTGNNYDVVIAGGGITGITTGLLLQKAGKNVLIAEANNIGFGTTGGTTAHLNTFLDTPYNQIKKDFGKSAAVQVSNAVKQALALIDEFVKVYLIDCGYSKLPGFLFAQDEKQAAELDEIYKASVEAGVQVAYTSDIPFSGDFTKAVRFEGQAQFHPLRYIGALANAFLKAGGEIRESCRITEVEKEGDQLKVGSSSGNFTTGKLIYATYAPRNKYASFPSAPYRSYAIAVELENEGDYPDALVYDMYDPYHYIRTQEIDGKKFLIVGGEDHKTGHETNTGYKFTLLENYVRKHYPVKSVDYRWSSQYFEPSDGLAYIGHSPAENENIFVATGYGGNGMIYGTVAAIVISDMILKGQSEFEEVFDPSRIKMIAGFSNLVKENADVVARFIGRLLPSDKITELSEIAHDDARIVKYEGHNLAIYKDEQGNVHAINPVCPHAKCEVAWNNAERSWDCPCHGSRFAVDGKVLTAPSRKDLEQVDLGVKKV